MKHFRITFEDQSSVTMWADGFFITHEGIILFYIQSPMELNKTIIGSVKHYHHILEIDNEKRAVSTEN